MNKIVKNALILMAITLVSGLLLGLVYQVTKDPIAAEEAKEKQEAYQAVFPDAASFEELDEEKRFSGKSSRCAGRKRPFCRTH